MRGNPYRKIVAVTTYTQIRLIADSNVASSNPNTKPVVYLNLRFKMMHNIFCTQNLRPRMGPCSYRNPLRRRVRRTSTVWAIGFQLPGNPPLKGAEASAEELVGASASLLLYQSVLKGKAGQAFLKMLLHLQNGSTVKLVEHYCEFYKELVALGVNWHDYLIDQVLLGSDNPFARAAAKGESVERFLPAVQHDLKVLQSLAVSNSTLTGWITDTAYKLPSTWVNGAAISAAEGNEGRGEGEDEGEDDKALDSRHNGSGSFNQAIDCIKPPLTAAQRIKVRTMISDCWESKPDAAAGMLALHYAAHDYGLVSLHRSFKWTGKSLQAQDVLRGIKAPETATDPEIVEQIRSALIRSLFPTTRQSIPHHIIVYGCAQTAYLCTIASISLIRKGQKVDNAFVDRSLQPTVPGLRLILLPPSRLSELSDLAWTMSQHPKVKFVVVCPQAPSSFDAEALMTLTGWDGFSFPYNAVFIACCNEEPHSKILSMVKVPVHVTNN